MSVESVTQVTDVTVRVDDGQIYCIPDPVTVTVADGQLVFALEASRGYVFREQNAIVVTNGGSEFPEPSVTSADGRTASLSDACEAQGSFKYTIYLKDPGGNIVSLDPEINNQPE